jgi:hypothetical protein
MPFIADGQNLEWWRCASMEPVCRPLSSQIWATCACRTCGHRETLMSPAARPLSSILPGIRPISQLNALIGLVAIAGNHAEPADQILHWMKYWRR